MRRWRIALAGVAALALALVALAWFLPARWALAVLGPRLHGIQLEQVGGTLWHGHAGRVLAPDGRDLGRARWTLSRCALFGDVRLDFALHGASLDAAGRMHRPAPGETDWRQLRIAADAALLDGWPALRGQRLGGRLDVHIDNARLQGPWPMRLDGAALWHDGTVAAAGRRLALGDLRLRAQGRDGVVRLRLDDAGGPLRAQGEALLSPLDWHYEVALRARGDDPALRAWLGGFGPLAPDGTLALRGSGGLAHWISAGER